MTLTTPAEQHLEVIEDAERILDHYQRTAPIETFSASHADRHSTELAGLRGARLVTANGTDEGRRWAESRINMLTGGDPVRARFMRQDLFEFTPQLKLVISGNHKPSLRSVGDDGRHSVGLHDDAPTFETRRHAEAVAINSNIREGRHAPVP
jgi:putative DNA primase/helicase